MPINGLVEEVCELAEKGKTIVYGLGFTVYGLGFRVYGLG